MPIESSGRWTAAFPITPSRRPRGTPAQRFAAALRAGAVLALLPVAVQAAGDTTPAQQLERFSAQAGAPGSATRGQAFFTSRHGGEWSCSSCHGAPPLEAGRHAGTGKRIEPLAPAANPAALTDSGKVDKWLRRNCKDVLARECTAAEKADLLAYLVGVRR
jgi:hypothetical protein